MAQIELTTEPIQEAEIRAALTHPAAGAVVVFAGTTRRWTDGEETQFLQYACHAPLARAELQRLAREAEQRWGLIQCHVTHRLGRVAVGEASVVVGVSAEHRAEAFAAAAWIMDQVKKTVPIWKEEHDGSGESHWVHPTDAVEESSNPSKSLTSFVESKSPPRPLPEPLS